MILPDVNLLLYAHNKSDERHEAASAWLGELLSGQTHACFAWETINGFIRVSTNVRAMPNPITLSEAFAVVSEWLNFPTSMLLLPTRRHFEILKTVAVRANARASLFSDASLAALAIEHGAILATTDRDFRLFDNLKTINPLAK